MEQLISLGLSMGAISNLWQLRHYSLLEHECHTREYRINYEDLRINGRQIQIDVMNSVREELRDQIRLVIDSLDNLLVVSTLMLSCGFGFVCEGTFPPEKAASIPSLSPVLVLYGIMCALTQSFSLWSVIFTLRVRYEVDDLLRDTVEDASRYLDLIVNEANPQESLESDEATVIKTLSESLLNLTKRVIAPPSGARGAWRTLRPLPSRPGRRGLQRASRGPVLNSLFGWRNDHHGATKRERTYNFYNPLAHLFLLASMVCASLTCLVLMYINIRILYDKMLDMWPCYLSIVGMNWFFVLVFVVSEVMGIRKQRRQREHAAASREDLDTEDEQDAEGERLLD